MVKIKKAKIAYDFILNIISSFILTGALQLVVYPILAKYLNEFEFGNTLTIMGIVNVIAVMFGAALNNIKLLNQDKYKEIKGDFKRLLYISLIIGLIIMGIVLIAVFKIYNLFNLITIMVLPMLTMLRSYMVVYYRINLDYRYILKHSIVTSIGYILGIICFEFLKFWPIIFLIGELISAIYLYKTTSFREEKNIKTKNYNNIKKDYMQLTLSNSIANILVYLDRMLINPILGAENVAIYFTASIVGKTVGIVLQPLASIILTYITKFKMDAKKIYTILTGLVIILGAIIYLITIPMAPILTQLLYKESYEVAKNYFLIANLGAVLMIMGSLIQPIILKYAHLLWQSFIQIIYFIIYFFGGIYMMNRYGLYGFCIVSVVANLIRLIILIGVGYFNIFIKNK